MNKGRPMLKILNALILLLTLAVTICGVCSFHTQQTYDVVNQYGETIRMWGAGIYAHDSYFKAPIFIGTDLTVLLFVFPLAVISFRRVEKAQNAENLIRSFGVLSLLLYYAASLSFGVTYNELHLVYIALFSLCFFSVGLALANLHTIGIRQKEVCSYPFTKGMKAFLFVGGISLFVAWLPDIIISIVSGSSLKLIEVYTTEVTYVLDMGIISPLIFITYYLVKHETFIGYVLLRMLFEVCMIIGIMLFIQTAIQLAAGILLPIPVMVTKDLIFILLAIFSGFFDVRLKHGTKYVEGSI